MNPSLRSITLLGVISTLVFAASLGCSAPSEPSPNPIDPLATPQTADLLRTLHEMAGTYTLFGHQNTLAYGYRWVDSPASGAMGVAQGTDAAQTSAGASSAGRATGAATVSATPSNAELLPDRSDVKDVTGSHPALFGWDLMDLFPADTSAQAAQEAFDRMVRYGKRSSLEGGVATYSWHMRNPLTGNSFYDTTRAVHALLPGGERHEAYMADLDRVAAFFQALSPEPVIFRPFHEHNGDWFWWCKAFTTEEDYVALWRFTQDYLHREKGVHNVLWAYSPDRSRMSLDDFVNDYHWGYPGDDRVDILGLDNYWDVGHKANTASPEQQRGDFMRSLTMMGEMALDRGKVTALTETGYETIPDSTWWTGVVLEGLQANRFAGQAVYLQVWRNANVQRERNDHYYAPFPGHPSAPDFVRFMQSERMVFETELDTMRAALGR